ncbi:MFS transporter [Candidatus Poriferisocius sp.]|uniref:MFS transporter n=1 Tax=Candidatus Poriferisocius sp. TaxID=3101276 RepID=UPI003B527857
MTDAASDDAGALSRRVLDSQTDQTGADDEVIFPDHVLPGVGGEQMSLREGLAKGGIATFLVLLILNSLDELESAALSVLAPEIRDSFGVGDGVIVFLGAASVSFVFLGALPMGWLADRFRRGPIIGVASLAFGLFSLLSGLARHVAVFFFARLGTGISKSNTLPVHNSLIADQYPIGVRGRIASLSIMSGRTVSIISPVLVGGIATLVSWRWTYYTLWIPVAVVAVLAFRLPEPVRGQWEKTDVLGKTGGDGDSAPISLEAAFARLNKVATLRTVLLGFAALGFGLFSRPVLTSLFLEDEYGLGPLGRGTLTTASGVGVIAIMPLVGRRFDRLYRENPTRAMGLIGALVLPSALLLPVQFNMPNPWLFAVLDVPGSLMMFAAFAMVGPLMQAVVPYRLRGIGSALSTLYIFFIGAAGGGLLSAMVIDASGPKTTILVLGLPSTIVGGAFMLNGARHIRRDLSRNVAEILEEQAEHDRQREDPEHIPALQLADVDFSYGNVQVLFDVGFEVRKGETLALLGTNGAGKSTILRIIAGLGTPERGVVRLNGRTITFSTPEQRTEMGIQTLLGGSGVWAPLSVLHNLEMGTYQLRDDKAERQRRIEHALKLFPELRSRLDDRADALSGGQQQMLALARTLLCQPEVLLIDELSLGLAPTAVAELMGHIERLQSTGQTIVIVEQSLNIALELADRAVFIEKGQVRFEGPASELAERDDLVRAVFLGDEGG